MPIYFDVSYQRLLSFLPPGADMESVDSAMGKDHTIAHDDTEASMRAEDMDVTSNTLQVRHGQGS